MSDFSVSQIENWYAANCDGDWEHQGGLDISTLDNPGWRVQLDLDTIKHRFDETVAALNRSEAEDDVGGGTDWVFYSFDRNRNVLVACCGTHNLGEVLAFMLDEANYEMQD
ncbi:MAG: Imm53 family immunity protein [Pseudomonadota bacterium]